MKFSHRLSIFALVMMPLFSQSALGDDREVKLTPQQSTLQVKHQGKMVTIERIQDPTHTLEETWAKTARKCPPFCPQPLQVAPGVTTVGEVEVFDFMRDKVNNGSGLIIDARVESWHKKGTIPSSVNIPFTEFERLPSDPRLEKPMAIIGAKRRGQVGFVENTWDKTLETVGVNTQRTGFWDFSESPDLLLWCNGPWCGQSPHAIKGLLKLGFPAEKIYYYRGGMQMWALLGLTTILPEDE
ncbi:MAG: rhodanese-like domain-containing protein [Gammaproteobacteria bacterium]|nr:rhodanese-like domain-containing protein [Gammaproteobacteria bacterium]MCW8839588.1 rhodanese-like domain-containing protein [Gammaproteobacteria bacterium]MCW8973659.1 rhodanese-like domain-containing protein [Gammaproteobacteria bacterium]MCW8991687.1 rhodanese-like domain-containing protein [Gammaproteobacteria bacterium]MCW9088945.1 rhodanese-like domain-containing protein [Gammaproteobacteria bacterium]